MDMLPVLASVEAMLPDMLAEPARWNSLRVDYHPPVVERLWTTVSVEGQDYRVYLHRIRPCLLDEALVHPHPWPSAMRVLSGSYLMVRGHGPGTEAPPMGAPARLAAGACYAMNHPDDWHAVCPEGTPAYSLMVTGTPWTRQSPKSPHPLKPLPDALQADIFKFFRQHYGVPDKQA